VRREMMAAAAVAVTWASAEAAELQDFQATTVDQLASICGVGPADDLHVEAIQFCYGYISGAMQFHDALVGDGGIRPIACPTAGATRQEFAAYFASWARTTATPEQLAEPAVQGMARAAAAKYPCPAR
jgi:Rap1a immunity proteins